MLLLTTGCDSPSNSQTLSATSEGHISVALGAESIYDFDTTGKVARCQLLAIMVQSEANRGTCLRSCLAQLPYVCDPHAGIKKELLAQYDHFPMVVVQVRCSALVVCSS